MCWNRGPGARSPHTVERQLPPSPAQTLPRSDCAPDEVRPHRPPAHHHLRRAGPVLTPEEEGDGGASPRGSPTAQPGDSLLKGSAAGGEGLEASTGKKARGPCINQHSSCIGE